MYMILFLSTLLFSSRFLCYSAIARDKSGATTWGRSLPHSPRGGHACPRPAPRASSPCRLSRLFFTSKFPKPARQSAGDRTADVPLTMSFWALALHKRGNSKNEKGGTDEHGGSTTARHDGIEGSACRTRRSYNAHFSCAPCFSTARPLLVSSPLASGLP